MPGTIAKIPKFQFLSASGAPLVNGTLTVYLAGSTTPVDTWQNQALTIANTNPITLDSRGECVLWLDSMVSYKFVLKNAGGVIQWTQDNVSSVIPVVADEFAGEDGSSLIGHIADGDGATYITVQQKLRQIVCVKDFGAVGNGIADDTLAFTKATAAAASIFVPPGDYKVTTDVLGGFYSFVPIEIVGGGSVSINLLSTSSNRLGYFSALMAAGEAVDLAAYGDSTTDGFATTAWIANPTFGGEAVGASNHNLNSPNSWPVQLQALLREMFGNATINVWNAGYAGRALSTGWAYDNYDRAVTDNPFYGTPQITIVAFGLNDVRPTGSQIADHASETRKLVAKLLARGTLPVLISCDPIVRNYDATNAILNREVTRQIDTAKRAFAAEFEIPFIDVGSQLRDWASNNEEGYRWFMEQSTDTDADGLYSSGDDVGLHFRDNGHKIKAQILAKELFTDTIIAGRDRQRLTAADARTNAFGNFLLTLSSEVSGTDTHNAQGFNFRVNAYDPNPAHKPSGAGAAMLTMWVWNTNPDTELMYRGVYYEGWTRTKADGVSVDNLPVPADSSTGPKVYVKNMLTGVAVSKVPACVGFQVNGNHRFSDIPYRFGRLPYGLSKVQYLFGDYRQFIDGAYSLANYGYFELYSPKPVTRFNTNALANTGEVRKTFTAADTLFLVPEQKDGSNLFGMFYADADYTGGDYINFYVDATIPLNSGVVLGWTKAWGGTATGVNAVVATVLHRSAAGAVRIYLVTRSGAGAFTKLYRTVASGPVTFTADRTQVRVRIGRVSEQQTIDIYNGFAGASVHSSVLTQIETIVHFGGAAGGIYWDSTAGAGSAAIHQLTIVRE